MRLIDADALEVKIGSINHIDYGSMYSYEAHSAARDALSDVLAILGTTLTVDPIRHGRWEKKELVSECLATCSHCKYPISWWHKTAYCPSCGAKMDKAVQK